MADKAITDLNTIPGSVDDNNTWFAVAQSGTAYKVSGHEFTLALGTILDGHGGVKSIVYNPPVAPSLTGTMVITLADNSTTTVSIQNGKGISSIAKTGTSGLVDTYTITYNDSTTSTFSVTNGAKGDTGDSWYVWIRYAGSMPTSDADMGTTPDDWIGIYSGTEDDPSNLHYTDFDWFEYKGEKGDTGTASAITTQTIGYQASNSGTVVPSGSWTTTIPVVPPGNYLWTRTQLAFNDGTTVTAYSVSRYGIDGSGAVSSVNNVSPDSNGNVALTGTDIPLSDNQSIQTHVTDAEDDIDDLKTSLSSVKSDLGIVEDTNTATHTIAQGQYVIWKDALYIASTAIPSGTTLSASNLTAVSGGGFNDLRTETGTSGFWTYKKHPDGTSECYGKTNLTVTCADVMGYHRGSITNISYPANLFISDPVVMATCQSSTYWVSIESTSNSEIEKLHVYDVVNGTGSATFGFHALGRWK